MCYRGDGRVHGSVSVQHAAGFVLLTLRPEPAMGRKQGGRMWISWERSV